MFAAVRRAALDRDLGGVAEVLLGEPADLRGHGGREQRHLLVVGGLGEDRLDVLGEAHVEHLVGLVEHQEAQLRQVEGALVEVVHDPTRGADDDVHAAAQRRELHAVGLAAVDGQHVHALHPRGVLLEGLAHLERELTGGGQHERLRALLRQVEVGEDRQRERGGLAGAGLREADHVATLAGGWGWSRPGWPTGSRSPRRTGPSAPARTDRARRTSAPARRRSGVTLGGSHLQR